MTLLVYALAIPDGARLSVRGIAGEPVRVIREGAVAALVSELQRQPRSTEDTLRRYDAVIRRLAARFPSLLPARFPTSFDDPAELWFVLRSRQASLRRALAHVRGRAQMTIRVLESGAGKAGEASGAGGAGKAGGGAQPAPTGSSYLRARAAAAAEERAVAGFEPIRAAVRRWVRDERVEKRAGVTSVYHLIPRGSAALYRTAAARAADAGDVRSVISGPWPAYAFADW